MIIGVSIVDKHRPAGHGHVGTYFFEVGLPDDTHYDFLVTNTEDKAGEDEIRPYCGRLLQKEEIPRPITGDGKRLDFKPARKPNM